MWLSRMPLLRPGLSSHFPQPALSAALPPSSGFASSRRGSKPEPRAPATGVRQKPQKPLRLKGRPGQAGADGGRKEPKTAGDKEARAGVPKRSQIRTPKEPEPKNLIVTDEDWGKMRTYRPGPTPELMAQKAAQEAREAVMADPNRNPLQKRKDAEARAQQAHDQVLAQEERSSRIPYVGRKLKEVQPDWRTLATVHRLDTGSRSRFKRRTAEPPSYSVAVTDVIFGQPVREVLQVHTLGDLPAPKLPEILLAGRSNVGKSTLLRNLCVSQRCPPSIERQDKPGTTKSLNFYDLGNTFRLIDMFGYGFAFVDPEMMKRWEELFVDYLSSRPKSVFRRVLVLVDARQGIKEVDRELFRMLEEYRRPFQLIVTKTDLVDVKDLAKRHKVIQEELQEYKYCLHDRTLLVSGMRMKGIDDLRKELFNMLTKEEKVAFQKKTAHVVRFTKLKSEETKHSMMDKARWQKYNRELKSAKKAIGQPTAEDEEAVAPKVETIMKQMKKNPEEEDLLETLRKNRRGKPFSERKQRLQVIDRKRKNKKAVVADRQISKLETRLLEPRAPAPEPRFEASSAEPRLEKLRHLAPRRPNIRATSPEFAELGATFSQRRAQKRAARKQFYSDVLSGKI